MAANAFRHSCATNVVITLEFEGTGLWVAVSDDGIGLPDDYASRRHGFGNMDADARRLGGALVVASGENGTTVGCVVPRQTRQGGR